ncbi:selenoprotein K-like [Ostrinia furnacalis]|uniref:selenoprotein K-like n=1 Tax=Ostrinia furnacalis TaxID=93504 RepID=UPI001039E9D3|nr:selenoprotein K-like [Ostrinia furnacalis]
MVYVTGDGTVVKSSPFSITNWIYAVINFLYLLFKTMFDPNYSKHGDKYVRDFRPPGSGPPKPPSRKFGGFGPSNSGPPPPPAGGCGCGG